MHRLDLQHRSESLLKNCRCRYVLCAILESLLSWRFMFLPNVSAHLLDHNVSYTTRPQYEVTKLQVKMKKRRYLFRSIRLQVWKIYCTFYPEDGGSICLRNTGIHQPDCQVVITPKTTIWIVIAVKIWNLIYISRVIHMRAALSISSSLNWLF
jgi:hypothetical protein